MASYSKSNSKESAQTALFDVPTTPDSAVVRQPGCSRWRSRQRAGPFGQITWLEQGAGAETEKERGGASEEGQRVREEAPSAYRQEGKRSGECAAVLRAIEDLR
jgi:hypothetical protein